MRKLSRHYKPWWDDEVVKIHLARKRMILGGLIASVVALFMFLVLRVHITELGSETVLDTPTEWWIPWLVAAFGLAAFIYAFSRLVRVFFGPSMVLKGSILHIRMPMMHGFDRAFGHVHEPVFIDLAEVESVWMSDYKAGGGLFRSIAPRDASSIGIKWQSEFSDRERSYSMAPTRLAERKVQAFLNYRIARAKGEI